MPQITAQELSDNRIITLTMSGRKLDKKVSSETCTDKRTGCKCKHTNKCSCIFAVTYNSTSNDHTPSICHLLLSFIFDQQLLEMMTVWFIYVIKRYWTLFYSWSKAGSLVIQVALLSFPGADIIFATSAR